MLQEKHKNLILAADDFGKSKLANENILKLAKLGKLDRVSVMIDGDFSGKEIEELKTFNIKLDIHFELIWQKRRRNLLRDHTLRQVIVFFVNYIWGDWPVSENPRSSASGVNREWKRQIEKFKSVFGQVPDGISSHEHTHYFPPYFAAAVKLAQEYKIPYIRFGRKGFLGKKNGVRFILMLMRRLNRKKYLALGISSSDYFASLDWIGNMDAFLKNIPEKKTEVSCHPERKEEFDFIDKYF